MYYRAILKTLLTILIAAGCQLITTPRPPSPTAAPPTASSPATPTPSSTAALPAITFSPDGRYAFPVAGDLGLMTWTHTHWDGSSAVDVEAARHFAAGSPEFIAFTQLPLVAVTNGVIAIADNPRGGLALWLHGDDGRTYYYAHLSQQWAVEGQYVQVGEPIGRIGNTGQWTQYIEPHLHFAIHSSGRGGQPDVNAAEQFQTWFGLPWQDLDVADYPPDQVAGWPVATPARITRSFAENQAANPQLGSIEIEAESAGDTLIPIYATLGGEINVNRATALGLRVQITNRHTRTTVVYSGLSEATAADGDVVQRGDVVGYLGTGMTMNYMLFINDNQVDPAPTLNRVDSS